MIYRCIDCLELVEIEPWNMRGVLRHGIPYKKSKWAVKHLVVTREEDNSFDGPTNASIVWVFNEYSEGANFPRPCDVEDIHTEDCVRIYVAEE